MKPYPYNERLFELLHESNAYLITLTVDSDKIIQTLNNYSYDDLAKIIDYCKKYKSPKTVGISFYYRIFKNTALEKTIRNDLALQKNLTRVQSVEENFLKPIFFNRLEYKDLQELIAGDELFRIAGIEPGVNYQL